MNYAYWLANVPGISRRLKQRLLAQAGSARELYFLPERLLKTLEGAGEAEVRAILAGRTMPVEASYDAMCGQGISFISMEDDSYPDRLRSIGDSPLGLYVKGCLPPQDKRSVAIVGARMCSEYGRAVADELGRKLAAAGVCVISGMARGIDTAGHWGAIGAGVTCAVLGCGADVCYPKSNRALYERILQQGCIVSEYPPGTQPFPALFPQRNRLIAGLSDVVVVVEAKSRSGSLITADFALEQGKDIYAVPGRMYDTLSAGCNNLIRQGAGVVASADDFLKEIGLLTGADGAQESLEKLLLEKEERLVYSCVDLRPRSIEELLRETGFAMPELSRILAGLVRKEFIVETFKNYYIRRI